jgi:phenylalanyl-tRNA synthetase beta chain
VRVSVDWLKDWIDVGVEPRELAHRLTMAGLEVEAIEAAAPPLEGVVVGEVAACSRHPNADTLSVCMVTTGGPPVQIVCGASNVRAGMKVAVATIGSRLPGGVEIRAARLRGVDSNGMLCSGRELGLSDESEGILELPAALEIGMPLTQALRLDDTIFTINVTPNRGDCMSVLGIAREVAAITQTELREIAPPEPAEHADAAVPVALTSGAGCERFVSRVIRGVRADTVSPAWLQERLRRAGLRPINAIVDVTNYVMLDLGQPLHAYDRAEIDSGIVVRRAQAGESLVLLDGRTIAMDEDVLVIADHSKVLGLAGVMGGEHSGIGPATRDVLLEVAYFDPAVIAGRGRRYGLVTDASQRFERGVDPAGQERALQRATQLLLELAGGTAGPLNVVEAVPRPPVRPPVPFRPERATRVIGALIESASMQRILCSLGMHVDARETTWQVAPPSWRFDIAIEEDLIEEVARIHGFENVPETPLAILSTMRPATEHSVPIDRLKDTLANRGYFEAVTYSFVDPDVQKLFDPDGANPLVLANPISADLAVMRTSLWPGLVRAAVENQRRQQSRVRLFEFATKFVAHEGRLAEVECIGGIATGPALPEQWGETARPVDFFDVRADLEAMLIGTRALDEFRWVPAAHPALHPGQTARLLLGDAPIGWLGRLHPEVEKALDLTYSGVVFEIETASACASTVPEYREVSRFPGARRDVAVVVAADIAVARLVEQARQSAGPLATGVEVFDIYPGPGIPNGLRSVAIGLNLQDVSRTLTDDDADAVVAQVVADLKREFNATIRDK